MRLITRHDFDGLICAVLLSEVVQIDDIVLAHAREIHDGEIALTDDDILANLPFDARCGLWFDHHSSETAMAGDTDFRGRFAVAPSCARVIFDYYQSSHDLSRYTAVVAAADKIDSADLGIEDIRDPRGWVLLSNTLRRFGPQGPAAPPVAYFKDLVAAIRTRPLAEILTLPAVVTRIGRYREEQEAFINTLREYSYSHENVVITDTRVADRYPCGNRFMIYTLYPQQNISINVFENRRKGKVILACGHNIFKRDSTVDIGKLLKGYGGGGHRGAGTCQVAPAEANRVLRELIDAMREDDCSDNSP